VAADRSDGSSFPRSFTSVRKRVLFAALSAASFETFQPAFGDDEVELVVAPSWRHGTKVAELSRFDMVLVEAGDGGRDLVQLLAALRKSGAVNFDTRAGLIANAGEFAHTAILGQRFGAKTFDATRGRGELQRAVRNLLHSRVRMPLKVMSQLAISNELSPTQLLCQTRNLSRSGMLVVTQSRFPVGSRVQFTLSLPESSAPIRGEGEVVRHTDRRFENADGVGVHFLSLHSDGDRQLAAFLERRRR
jgi:Tfp pilus assembly protein PilZ